MSSAELEDGMMLFALKGSDWLGGAIARAAGATLSQLEERDFEDGEHKARPLVSVRGKDVFVIHSLGGLGSSVNDRLVKLLFFLATCKSNGAARVTAVMPYLAYARKDRQTKARDPLSMRYVAQLLEAVGVDRVAALEVHNYAAFQNAFRCPTVHLNSSQLFLPAMRPTVQDLPVTIFSPDGGGLKRAQLLKERFEAQTGEDTELGFMEKRRSSGIVSGDLFVGAVEGRAVFIVDDMISTGGTVLRAARACRERGAREVHVLATHALFSQGSGPLFEDQAVDRVIVSDSVGATVTSHPSGPRLEVVSCANLVGEAIRRLHENESISDLVGFQS
jgi:ribose-phosphate pyrophosphokinase